MLVGMALTGSWGAHRLLSALWSSTAALPPVAVGAALTYRALLVSARRAVRGRTVTVRLDDGELTATIVDLTTVGGGATVATGRLDSARLVATDLRWGEHRADRVLVVLHDVALRPGNPSMLTAASVELSVELSTALLDDLLRRVSRRLSGEIDAAAVPRLRWARRPGWGALEVAARLDGPLLRLQPVGLTGRRRRWRVPAWAPGYAVRLPELPRRLQLTGLSCEPQLLRVTATLPDWRMPLPHTGIEDMLNQLNTVGRTLNLTGAPLAEKREC